MFTIKNGKVYQNNKKIGTATKDLKFGYHPSIVLKVGGKEEEWFELDTPELISTILKRAEQLK